MEVHPSRVLEKKLSDVGDHGSRLQPVSPDCDVGILCSNRGREALEIDVPRLHPTIPDTSAKYICRPFPPCGESKTIFFPSGLKRGVVSHRHTPVYSGGE